jgi:hypothetical protein
MFMLVAGRFSTIGAPMPYVFQHEDLFIAGVTAVIIVVLGVRWAITRKRRQHSSRSPEV